VGKTTFFGPYGDRVAVQVDEGFIVGHSVGACDLAKGADVTGASRESGTQHWVDAFGNRVEVFVDDFDRDIVGLKKWIFDGS
jgi:hypothetical protein